MGDGQNSELKESCGSISREKYWKELSTVEQIERMRSVIHSLTRETQAVRSSLYKLRSHLKEHKHLDGKLVVPLDVINQDVGESVGMLNKNPDEVYF